MGMSNTDIDSIGKYANAYDGLRELHERNGSRVRFFVPSVLLIFDKLIVITPSLNLLFLNLSFIFNSFVSIFNI